MKEFENFDLYNMNTMRLHSIARKLYEPDTIDELIDLCKKLKKNNEPFHILGAGSNIVFDDHVETPIVSVMGINKILALEESNLVECGANIRVQALINYAKKYNLGGLEYLYSVPTSIGGAVYMNAGRGRKHNKSISDFVTVVEYLDLADLQKKVYVNDKNEFLYRKSPFQTKECVILKVKLELLNKDSKNIEESIKERLEVSKKFLSANKPSCGSVFNKCNPIIMRLLKGVSRGGASFSKKTPNWISNNGEASAKDVMALINIAVKIHKIFMLKYNLEVKFLR